MNKIVMSVLATGLMISGTMYAQKATGYFEAEGQKIETKFVRVLYAAEGSEDGKNTSTQQLIYKSVDPRGKEVEVVRFQITAKNTGYDEVQPSQEQDYKMKQVQNGVKLHIEVPVINGNLQLDKAYVGNLAYNFGTKETRHNLKEDAVSNIKLDIKKMELPSFTAQHHPGDKGLIYNEGYIRFTMKSEAKSLKGDQTYPFIVVVDGPISLTHVRGKERASKAVPIDAGIVKKNEW